MTPSIEARKSSVSDRAVRYGLHGLILAGIFARFFVSLISDGSNDTFAWRHFAAQINAHGLLPTYSVELLFNHPPVISLLIAKFLALSEVALIPFPFLLRLPSILGDVGTVYILYKLFSSDGNCNRGLRAAATYSCCVSSILISGFHGNTDGLCVFFLFASIYAAERCKNRFIAGVLLGISLNVKLIPCLVLPALFLRCGSKEEMRQAALGMALALLPFFVIVLVGGEPIWRNVLAYNSVADNWGIPVILSIVDHVSRELGAGLVICLTCAYVKLGRIVLIAAEFIIAVLGKAHARENGFVVYASALVAFLLFANGFGLQYLIYPLPFLLVASFSWGWWYSVVSSLFAAVAYAHYMIWALPLQSIHNEKFAGSRLVLGLLTWGFLFFWSRFVALRELRGPRSE